MSALFTDTRSRLKSSEESQPNVQTESSILEIGICSFQKSYGAIILFSMFHN